MKRTALKRSTPLKRARMKRKPTRNPLPREMRERVMREDPRCAYGCGRPSTEPHHLKNPGLGMKDHSRGNLRGVCARCHTAAHAGNLPRDPSDLPRGERGK